MKLFSTILILIVAIEHIYILILEMFLWTKPKGIKTFGLKSKDFAESTKVLAGNQGLYNGFLAAGLIYSLIENNESFIIFFLCCVIVAGLYGAYSTGKPKLFYMQSMPALIAVFVTFLSNA